MRNTLLRAGLLPCALLATTCLTSPALAQLVGPLHRNIDANGVDLTNGGFFLNFVEGSIGSGRAELPLFRRNGNQWDNIFLERSMNGSNATIYVSHGTTSELFTGTGGSLTNSQANGGTLDGGGDNYTYTARDGTTIHFTDPTQHFFGGETSFCHGDPDQPQSTSCRLLPESITSPDGKTVTLSWNVASYCATEFDEENHLDCQYFWRLGQVENSFGYRIGFTYTSDEAGGTLGNNPAAAWWQRTGSSFYNNAVSQSTPQGSASYASPSAGVTDVTDMAGRTWRFTYSGQLVGIRRPGASSDTTTISYTGGQVSSVTRDGVTTNYSRSVSGNTATMTITDAATEVTTVVSNISLGRITSVIDPLSRQTSFQYDTNGRLTRITQPEGDYVEFTLDSRGNITQTRHVDKSGPGANDIVTSATFASSCVDNPGCNQPLTTTDARGNVTDYTYDSTHGGVLTVTAPAPTGTTRPQTRYIYELTNGEYQLTAVSACASGTASSCVGTVNETRMVVAYDAQGNVTSVERRSGNTSGTGAVSATSTMTYTNMGDLATVDGPLSGTADTTRYRYNTGRQPIGVIGPDPDGTGTLHHRASRTTYGSHGLPTKVERGNVNSQSDSDWAGFTSLEEVQQEYDGNHRPTVQRLVAGSTTYALNQTSYDSLGRVQCMARRMNSSEFATSSLPSSACTLDTEGSLGPDRITRTTYDDAGQATLVQTGYGVTGVQADEVATAYTSNGRVSHVTDAEGNRTTYEYDGHDRLVKTRFPSPTTDGAGSTTDYEQFTLDANGNVTSHRRRDGTSMGYTFDALNRVTFKDVPGGGNEWDLDVTYAYDLLNRMTSASTTARTVSSGFDALGRRTSETTAFGMTNYQYDVAGRMTSNAYASGGLTIGYAYNVAGDLTEIRENPAGSNFLLATYSYDDLGRRTLLTRGNGTTTSYTYDAVSRLSQLAHNIGGSSTTYDVTLEYTHNPAAQIASTIRNNDTYAWPGHYAVNRPYTADGLNRYSAAGSITPTYDARGNMTSAGSATYIYTSDDRLARIQNVIGLYYDPLGRLGISSGVSNYYKFDYQGRVSRRRIRHQQRAASPLCPRTWNRRALGLV